MISNMLLKILNVSVIILANLRNRVECTAESVCSAPLWDPGRWQFSLEVVLESVRRWWHFWKIFQAIPLLNVFALTMVSEIPANTIYVWVHRYLKIRFTTTSWLSIISFEVLVHVSVRHNDLTCFLLEKQTGLSFGDRRTARRWSRNVRRSQGDRRNFTGSYGSCQKTTSRIVEK